MAEAWQSRTVQRFCVAQEDDSSLASLTGSPPSFMFPPALNQ